MRQTLLLLLIATLVAGIVPAPASAEEKTEERVKALESQVSQLESAIADKVGVGGIVFLLDGIFCALWAQNAGRNAWLWFFLVYCSAWLRSLCCL